MSKELEALEWLGKFKGIELSRLPFKDDCGTKEVDLNEVRFVGSPLNKDFHKFVNVIEQALTELQAIKNSNPSEAMKCFKRVWNDINGHNDYRQDFEDLKMIENYILKAQEQEKALNIIIKKNVSVWGFRNRVFGYQKEQNGNKIINDTYEYYLYHFGCYHNGFDIELLTEEEFNLLKEYFKC